MNFSWGMSYTEICTMKEKELREITKNFTKFFVANIALFGMKLYNDQRKAQLFISVIKTNQFML
jgi:hypothetical protein